MTTKRDAKPKAAEDDETPGTALQRRFGENFREARLIAGLTQKQVSDLSGVEQADVSRMEHGTLNLTLRTMDKLAKVVDAGADHLLQSKPLSKPLSKRTRQT